VNLQTYIERFSAADLARALGVTPSFVTQMAKAGPTGRPVPVKRCVQVELATCGKVTRKELRDDWREIWPELEAIERAADAIRAARRSSTRSGAAGYRALQTQPRARGQRPQANRLPNKKTTFMDDLLLLSLAGSARAGHPRMREIRL
jgi:DNA-binding transcriptional regulator YdaS (Cro superfamily)